MSWSSTFKEYIRSLNDAFVMNNRSNYFREDEQQSLLRKKQSLQQRNGKIVKSIVDCAVLGKQKIEGIRQVNYLVHFQYLIKQGDKFFMEEKIEERRAVFTADHLIDDYCPINERHKYTHEPLSFEGENIGNTDYRYHYSRLEAVRYAERWWNDYNPNYPKFENNNCTNFISQCLHAGGAPMTAYSNRNKGWWYRNNNWSFSWAVAHTFRWYLSGAKTGLRAQEVSKPEALIKGDVICYDFNGDGRWQHTTIVVAKDSNNMPLVNAQTSNSRMRYWAYEDSTAWTPNIKYKFFHIING